MLNDDRRLRDEEDSGVECPDLLGVECPDLLEAPPTPEEQVNIVEALLMLLLCCRRRLEQIRTFHPEQTGTFYPRILLVPEPAIVVQHRPRTPTPSHAWVAHTYTRP